MSARAASWLLIPLLLGWSGPAAAWVPSLGPTGEPIRWANRQRLTLTPRPGTISGVSDSDLLEALRASAAGWGAATRACSYLELEITEPSSSAAPDPGLIEIVDSGWQYGPEAVAVTLIEFEPSSGAPTSGSIALNADGFTFDVLPDSGTEGGAHDVQNIVTHELGHFMGLDHTCDDGGTTGAGVDDQGRTVPYCCPDGSPRCGLATVLDRLRDRPELYLATMFNFGVPGEVQKRTPEPDDVAGICDSYPGKTSQPAGQGSVSGHGTVTVTGDVDQDVPPRQPGQDVESGGCSVAAGDGRRPTARFLLLLLVCASAGLGGRRRVARRS